MCNKISYETKQVATKHHNLLMRNPRNNISCKQRPYLCDICGDWHLTKQLKSKTKRYKKKHLTGKKQYALIKEFISIKITAEKYVWILKYQGKWMQVFIGDVNYVIFNGKTRVII